MQIVACQDGTIIQGFSRGLILRRLLSFYLAGIANNLTNLGSMIGGIACHLPGGGHTLKIMRPPLLRAPTDQPCQQPIS
jgi:hypothetical protein